MDAEPGSILIRNAGAIVSGDLDRPLLDASSVYVEEGVIVAIGEDRAAARTIDAQGNLLLPGLWDAQHYPYFGDHAPAQDAWGYMKRTVCCGTTALVSAGTVHVDGAPTDAEGTKQLAILSARSWAYDRPLGIKVHAGTVVYQPGLTERDVADLARAGVRRLVFSHPPAGVGAGADAARCARRHGLVILATVPAAPAVDCDVVLGANASASAGPDWARESHAGFLSLVLAESPREAARLVEAVDPHRLVIGTATPSGYGVVPGGVQVMLRDLIALTSLAPEAAIALATGNTARAYRLEGGVVAVGAPADLVIAGARSDRTFTDGLAALRAGDWLAVSVVLVDGEVRFHGETWPAPPRHPALLQSVSV